ncbi:MAG TPA: MATE family efflux transporter [Bacteroidales bacterium]|jgi:putative MATE family efflux protein|nr:MATE family efflux transporter [Bacteroidales bacterium]HOL97532.1 MATE family efflux transporter [Bacteroidales bacterium]HOM35800.1 MATE family efflux transporter [Bacteroidales bacterium]HPD22982.1 MATE family efflux transporter [Bacteroidales bacterium]HRS98821.1 MATE family efflux transporter [Bacteroidales bacterium]
MKHTERLESENIPRLLLSMSGPSILGMMAISVYNITDTIFLGHGAGTVALAAVAVALPVLMTITTFGHAIGMGGASIISRALGSKKKLKAQLVLHNIITAISFFNFFLILLLAILPEFFLRLFGANEEILPQAKIYLLWCLPGAFFQNILYVLMNAIRAEGNTKFPMKVQAFAALLNIILDPIFIFGFSWGVMGAAIATSISQTLASLACVWYFTLNNKSYLKINLAQLYRIPEKNIITETFALGASSFARQMASSVMTVVLNHALIRYGGTVAIASFGIILRLSMLIFMPLFGLNQAFMPIAGYNYGAKNFHRVIESIKVSIKWSTWFCIFSLIIYFSFSKQLIMIFTTDSTVIEYGGKMLKIFIIAFPVIGFQIIVSGLYQSLGKAKSSLFLALARQVLFLIPFVLLLPLYFGEIGIWISFPTADFLAALITLFMLINLTKVLKTTQVK